MLAGRERGQGLEAFLGLDRKNHILHAEGYLMISPYFSHFFSFRGCLLSFLCLQLKLIYLLNICLVSPLRFTIVLTHTCGLVIQDIVSAIYHRAGAGIESARVSHEHDSSC